jgi:hypothetical protein
MLDEYNEKVNFGSCFSIHKVLDIYAFGHFFENEEYFPANDVHRQVNSGMLGVHGNIGFSTALHGLVVCRECGEDKCVCVGDDALGVSAVPPIQSLIPSMNRIGTIHPEKFDILCPGPGGSFIKFLKRRLTRLDSDFLLSVLFDFPTPPYIDGNCHQRTEPPSFTIVDRINKVAGQVGALLWDIKENPTIVTDEDLNMVNIFLGDAYKSMKLPYSGFLPGYSIETSYQQRTRMVCCLPPLPLHFDPRTTDWLEHLFGNPPQPYFEVPNMTTHTDIFKFNKGDEFHVGESNLLSALEDLGIVKTELCLEQLFVGNVANLRVLRKILQKSSPSEVHLNKVIVLRDYPESFESLFIERSLVEISSFQNEI